MKSLSFLFFVLSCVVPAVAMHRDRYFVSPPQQDECCCSFVCTLKHRLCCPGDTLCHKAIIAVQTNNIRMLSKHVMRSAINMVDVTNAKTLADYAIESEVIDTEKRVAVLVWLMEHGFSRMFDGGSPLAVAMRRQDKMLFGCLLKYTWLNVHLFEYLRGLFAAGNISEDFYFWALERLKRMCRIVVLSLYTSDSLRNLARNMHRNILAIQGEDEQKKLAGVVSLPARATGAAPVKCVDCAESSALVDPRVSDWVVEQQRRSLENDIFSDPVPSLPGTADACQAGDCHEYE